jgi:hypothetical protein
MLGHPRLERGKPRRIGALGLGEQLVARPHRRFVARRVRRVAGLERERQAIEEAAAVACAVGEQRSIAGVSHSTDSHSDSELTDAAAPLMRT